MSDTKQKKKDDYKINHQHIEFAHMNMRLFAYYLITASICALYAFILFLCFIQLFDEPFIYTN